MDQHDGLPADWVQELASRVLSVTADPDLCLAARLQIGWALVWSNRQADALSTLISVAEDASPRVPAIAWHAMGLAATVVYQSGLPAGSKALLHALDRMEDPAEPLAGGSAGYADEQRVWIRACTDPFGSERTVTYLRRIAGGTVTDLARVGAAAWLLNEIELAVRLLREALSQLRAPGVRGRSGAALSSLQWACIDSGRWDEALAAAAAAEAADAAAAYKMEFVAASADLSTATVLAMRGHHDQVPPLLARALSAVDAAEYHSVAARARHAAGIAALAEGGYLTAYVQLSQLFDDDGTPMHHQVSYLGIADLAAAAVRADRHLEARTLVDRALGRLDQVPGPRLAQLAARARGLLAQPADAEGHFAKALSGLAGEGWPFERAQLQLDYGEWLRRQRRINDAKPVLAAALETFRRLGAAPWSRRAETELRASGVTAQGAHGTRRACRAHHPTTRDRRPSQPRPDQRRNRRSPVPVPPHRSLPPVPLLPEARHSRPPPAPRPDRPGSAKGSRSAGRLPGSGCPEGIALLIRRCIGPVAGSLRQPRVQPWLNRLAHHRPCRSCARMDNLRARARICRGDLPVTRRHVRLRP